MHLHASDLLAGGEYIEKNVLGAIPAKETCQSFLMLITEGYYQKDYLPVQGHERLIFGRFPDRKMVRIK